MPIRIACPSCKRSGRVPDHAIGRKVSCPACGFRYVLSAEHALPEGLELIEDDPVPTPGPSRASSPRPEAFELAPDPPLPSRAPGPSAYRRAPEPGPEPGLRFFEDGTPTAALWASMAGAALLLVGTTVSVTWWTLSGRAAPEPPRAQSIVAAPPRIAQAAPPPAVLPAALAPAHAPGPDADQSRAVIVPIPSQKPSESAPVPSGTTLVSTPNAAAPAPSPVPDSSPEPDFAQKAKQAAASTLGADPGKALSTADIVDESEPSIGLVKGKGSSGTGFLVAPGLLVTNAHVIDDEFLSTVEVRFPGAGEGQQGPIKVELLYEDAKRDIAILALKSDLPPLRLAKEYKFRKGEDITVIGNPGVGPELVLENAVNKGVMSTKATLNGQNFHQLGITINPGNSGGPVFDSTGRVIGIATLKTSKQEGLAFSIPIEDLHEALGKLASQPASESARARSRHRAINLAKGLSSGGAIYCVAIDLKRAVAAGIRDPKLTEMNETYTTLIDVLDKDVFPTFGPEMPGLKGDNSLTPSVRSKIGDLSRNFERLRSAYGGANIDLNQMKQTHGRLTVDLVNALKLDLPKEMLIAFQDHGTPGQSATTVVVSGFGPPSSAGSLRDRMMQRRNAALNNVPNGPSRGTRTVRPGSPSSRSRVRSR